jgi:lysophospholipase L1-like esterase
MPVPRRVGRAAAVAGVASTAVSASRSQARSGATVSGLNAGLIIAEGDSLQAGFGATPWSAALLVDEPQIQVINVATAGEQIGVDMLGQGASQVDANFNAAKPWVLYAMWGGTNDMDDSNRSAAQVYGDLQTWCAARRSAHPAAKILVLTCPAREDIDASLPGRRAAYNALLAADGLTSFDILVDTVSAVGTPGSQPTYWQADHLHLTNAGQVVVKNLVRAALYASLG